MNKIKLETLFIDAIVLPLVFMVISIIGFVGWLMYSGYLIEEENFLMEGLLLISPFTIPFVASIIKQLKTGEGLC